MSLSLSSGLSHPTGKGLDRAWAGPSSKDGYWQALAPQARDYHDHQSPDAPAADAALHAPTRGGTIWSIMLHVIVRSTVWLGDAAVYSMEYG